MVKTFQILSHFLNFIFSKAFNDCFGSSYNKYSNQEINRDRDHQKPQMIKQKI